MRHPSPDPQHYCRYCQAPLEDAERVYLNYYNNPTTMPCCHDCYERSIRYDWWVERVYLRTEWMPVMGFNGRLRSEAIYHGEGE